MVVVVVVVVVVIVVVVVVVVAEVVAEVVVVVVYPLHSSKVSCLGFHTYKTGGWTYWRICFGGMDPLGPYILGGWDVHFELVLTCRRALVSVRHCNKDKRVIL